MIEVSDEYDMSALQMPLDYFGMHLGYKRTYRIDNPQLAPPSRLFHSSCAAMGGEDGNCALRYFAHILNENCPKALETRDYLAIVHDCAANVDRGAMGGQCVFDGGYSPPHTCTEATRIG